MSQTYNLPQPRPVPWSRVAIGVILVAGLVAILNLTGVLAQLQSLIPGTSSAQVSYQSSTVSRGNVAVSVTATGPVSAVTSIPLSFKTSGKLLETKVSVGDQVAKGQVLATLDTTDLQIALQQAKATLAQAQANLAKIQAGSTTQAVAAAQTTVDNANRTAADAQASLKTTAASSAENLQAAQASVATAQTSLTNATNALAASQDQSAKSLAADQATIAIDQKNLDLVKATVAADLPVLEQQIAQAKNNLWSTQISRDATCGRGTGGQCDAANASVAAATTAVSTSQAQLAYSQKQSDQQIASAQATLDLATLQLSKDQAAQKASVVSAQNQVNQAQAALKSAQIAVGQSQASAAASAQSAQAQITGTTNAQQSAQAAFNQTTAAPLPSDLASATAQVQSAQAAVDAAQNNLDSATLTAPFDGTIAAVNGSVGQWISGGTVAATSGSSASTTAIFTEMNLNNLQVAAQVNEADISKVKVGDNVTFNVSAFPNQTFQGKVLSVQPVGTTSSNVVVYTVTSSIQSSANASLYPGMTATVTIVSAEHDNVLSVPATALTFAQTAISQGLVQRPSGTARSSVSSTGKTSATTAPGSAAPTSSATGGTPASTGSQNYVVTLTQGKLTLVPVTVGLTNGSATELSSGVQAGDSVVTARSGATITRSTTTSNNGGGASFIGGGP